MAKPLSAFLWFGPGSTGWFLEAAGQRCLLFPGGVGRAGPGGGSLAPEEPAPPCRALLVCPSTALPRIPYVPSPRVFFSLKVISEEHEARAEGRGLHTCLQLSSLFLCSLISYDSRKDSPCNAELSLSQERRAWERISARPALLARARWVPSCPSPGVPADRRWSWGHGLGDEGRREEGR